MKSGKVGELRLTCKDSSHLKIKMLLDICKLLRT